MQPSTDTLVEGAFTGTVAHVRRYDVDHRFAYKIWMVLAKLPVQSRSESRLPWLLKPRWKKYLTRRRIVALTDTKECDKDVTVWLLTQPSLVGRSFNPVSFYFVEQGQSITTIVAHITNTPWDEDHCYVLKCTGSATPTGEKEWAFPKNFHVSPFLPMSLRYLWRFELNERDIEISMKLFEKDEQVFHANLAVGAVKSSLARATLLRLAYPLQNLRTLSRIYLQAAILKFKGARFHVHPDITISQ